MHTIRRLIIWIALAATWCGLAACAAETPTPLPDGPRDYLYGRWVYTDPTKSQAELIFDFQRGGGLLLGSEGVFLETTFEFIDDQTILVAQGSEEPLRMTWKIEGNTLTLTHENEIQVLQRREN